MVPVKKKIARVFPRKTNASPTDSLCFFDTPPDNIHVDEVHISHVFTYDKKRVDELANAWEKIAPVKIGGPAHGDSGGEFTPGMYLKNGYTITSRGCPNSCWFCDVWRREGRVIRELEIKKGNNILDSNLLACSDNHIKAVFKMLTDQKNIEFTGGLEAKRLKQWHVREIRKLRVHQIFFAYDTPDDLGPLIEAGNKLRYANFTRQHLRCYLLIGYPKDTIQLAQIRLIEAWTAGFMPMAMLWKNEKGDVNEEWRKFQRQWARPIFIKRNMYKII